jgi:hypothetical protein
MHKLHFELSGRSRRPIPQLAASSMVRRVVFLTGSLLLVIVLMMEAKKPQNWEWFARLSDDSQRPGDAGHVDRSAGDAALTERSTNPSHPADSFVSRLVSDSTQAKAEPADHPPAGPFAVDYQLLASVRDNTYFRNEEKAAWFHLFGILQRSTADDLDRAAVPVGYVQLFRQSKEFRGRLVRIDGTVRRAERMAVPVNDIGLTEYWQLWIRLDDGSNSPVVAYTIDMPAGFPAGENLHEPVSLTAFGYKRWPYAAQKETLLAPVVLAKTARWTPTLDPAAREVAAPRAIGRLVIVGCISGIALAVLLFLTANSGKLRRPDDERRRVSAFARNVRHEHHFTVGEQLAALESSHRESPEHRP